MFRMRNECVRRARTAATMVMVVALVVLHAAPVAGQTVTDATRAEFLASADHSASGTDGTPLLSSYLLQIFTVGSTTVVQSIDLGKPTPESDGYVRVNFASRLTSPLTPGVEYQARVAAVGPGGTAPSELSNSFVVTAPCAPVLSATSASVAAGGASGTVTVTAPAGCAWTAASSLTWLTVTSGASGSGPGTVGYTAAANTGSASRSGPMTIAGQTFSVTQAAPAPACTYGIAPATKSAVAAADSATVAVTAPAGCAWTSTSGASWITVSAGATGSANGTVTLTVAPNTAAARTGSATIAGRAFTVSQAAPVCAYTVTPGSVTATAVGLSSSLSVATTGGCSWTASGMPAWITISTASRSGPGMLAYTVAPNSGGAARSATVTIAGGPVVFSQATSGPPPAPSNFRVVAGGSSP